MTNSISRLVIDKYIQTNNTILDFLQNCTPEQIRWKYQPEHHSIAFHTWHVARWTDHFQASVPLMTPALSESLSEGKQLWELEKLAQKWGFLDSNLGFAQTGMHMSDALAVQLPFPDKNELLDYVESVFSLAEAAVSVIDDEQFHAMEQPQPLTEGIWGESTVGAAILSHLTHANRHLGMMESLLGFQSGSGTATQ